MANPNRSPEGVAQCMDAYTVVEMDDENVIVALPNVIDSNPNAMGALLFGKNYILDLCSNAIEHGVLTVDDVKKHLSLNKSATEE